MTFCLDTVISEDNVVRLINEFVDVLDLEALQFTKTKPKEEGCPIYHAKDMLKLYYYGYFNRIRSCRKLEAEMFAKYRSVVANASVKAGV